jgi:hypothetical protein
MTNKNHPIYSVYDAKRTACLNIKYYGRRLRTVERQNFWIEVAIAISAPTSAVAGTLFFDTAPGHFLWQVMTFIAATLAVAKPFMKLGSKIKKLEHVLSGYRAMLCDIEDVLNRCLLDRAYSKAAQKMFDAANRKKRTLVAATPEATHIKSIVEECMIEVEQEIPHTTFYIPEDENGDQQSTTA